MSPLRPFFVGVSLAAAFAAIVSGQASPIAPSDGRGTAGGPPSAVRSPEVHLDRTVTFRLRAPAATGVELAGEVMQGKWPRAMTKGPDGVWSVTIGPLPPEIWIYNF